MIVRNLDWLWKWFLYTPNQPAAELIRIIQPTIDLSRDWPQTQIVRSNDYNSIVGTLAALAITPAEGKHWIIDHFTIDGAFTALDQVFVYLTNGTLDILIDHWILAGGRTIVPIVGAQMGTPFSTGSLGVRGRSSLYVGPGVTLKVFHLSTAAVAFSQRLVYREYQSFVPAIPLNT
jgi:hypothetical protein